MIVKAENEKAKRQFKDLVDEYKNKPLDDKAVKKVLKFLLKK